MRRATGIAVMLIAALALTAGCRTMTGQSLGTNIDNQTTTANVKARLAAERLQNLGWVDVDANRGTVFLSGTASTEQQKRRAEDIALSVDGVQRVVNNIRVKSTATGSEQPSAAGTSGSTGTSASPPTAMSASATAAGGMQRYTASGEVVSIDRASGQLTLQSNSGPVTLNVPQDALGDDIRVGDRVTVDLEVRRLP